ncbi:hypothetical protein [Ascidiimonas aurantiaca]|uniref:hypothetical protein n=1 Tax=Ascidiimonas aurantiaca TaxID=1685432 RepID=UPI0030EC3FBD
MKKEKKKYGLIFSVIIGKAMIGKKDLMIVHDGGNGYFNLKVNLTNKTYSELSINGYA